MPLFLLFVILPITELTLILQFHGVMASEIGSEQSTWISIAIILATGILGAKYAKQQGKRVLRELQEKMAQGQMPNDSLLKGLLILIGGAMLLTPGYLTDFLGLSFLFPLTQSLWASKVSAYFKKMQNQGRVHFQFGFPGTSASYRQQKESPFSTRQNPRIDPDVIDVPPSDWKEN